MPSARRGKSCGAVSRCRQNVSFLPGKRHVSMPLLREWESDPYSLAAIWEIAEPEHFFVERTGIQSAVSNPKRRMEHLAGRFLLKYLKQDFPLLNIRADAQDKPRLEGNPYYFSISHSFPYVAAVVSPFAECGIDIQVWHPRILSIQHKFLSEQEQALFGQDPRLVTLAWCIKEAAYKWQGRRGVEFIDHLPLLRFDSQGLKAEISLPLAGKGFRLQTCGILSEDFACACVENDRAANARA